MDITVSSQAYIRRDVRWHRMTVTVSFKVELEQEKIGSSCCCLRNQASAATVCTALQCC